MNLHEKTVGINPNNDSNYSSRHRSMTLDFDPFWMFKMIGDPLLLIGDPREGSPKKNGSVASYFPVLRINVCKTWNYSFRLQKWVKFWVRHRILIRDPKVVYGFICYFPPKMSGTLKTWGGGKTPLSPPPCSFWSDNLRAFFVVRLLKSSLHEFLFIFRFVCVYIIPNLRPCYVNDDFEFDTKTKVISLSR